MTKLTPSQTIGPFFYEGMKWLVDLTLDNNGAEALTVVGCVFDGNGEPVSDALIEVWIPSAGRNTQATALAGFQRVCTDAHGRYCFRLPEPKSVPMHANVTVFARGLLRELITRLYVAPPGHIAKINVSEHVPESRKHTLIGRRSSTVSGQIDWDIRLQGQDETVFFDLR